MRYTYMTCNALRKTSKCVILFVKTEERDVVRPTRSYENIINVDLGEIGCGDVDWLHLRLDGAQYLASANTVMYFPVP
jgi:hypothetical protein